MHVNHDGTRHPSACARAQHMDSMLGCLKHPITEANATIRRNLLSAMPSFFQRCGGNSLHASLAQLVPPLVERLVDSDPPARELSRRALVELVALTRPAEAVGALLSKPVLGRGARTREALLLLLAELLHRRLPSSSELGLVLSRKEHLGTLLRLVDDLSSPTTQSVLAVVQQLHAAHLSADLRQQLAAAASASGLPRHSLRIALSRLDDVDRGLAPEPPTLSIQLQSSRETVAGRAQGQSCREIPPHKVSSPASGSGRAELCASRSSLAGSPCCAHTHRNSASPSTSETMAANGIGSGAASVNVSRSEGLGLNGSRSEGIGLNGSRSDIMNMSLHRCDSSEREGGRSGWRKSVGADIDFTRPPSPVKARSSEEAARELREIARELRKPPREADGVWQERAAAMRRLHGLLLGGSARLPHFSQQLHSLLVEPLRAQLKDLRSRCVRIACGESLARLSVGLG